MMCPYLDHDPPLAPLYIFVRTMMSDEELLSRFSLSDYVLSDEARPGHHALLGNDGEWTMLADDWSYRLWHMPTTRPAIAAIGKEHDVFTCSVGDIDHSYDFAYYQGGRLVRNRIFSDGQGRIADEDFGDPLPGEANRPDDELDFVLAIAASLGIWTRRQAHEIRVYGPRERES